MGCYVCGGERKELVTGRLRYESPKKIYRCLDCGLVFLSPQMTPDEERSFYEKEYGEIFSKEKGCTPEDLFNARQPDAAAYYELAAGLLDKNSDCLEIGCASGYFLQKIKDKVSSVAGIESHLLLRKYCEEIGIRVYEDIDKCPARSFDRVFLFFVVEHLGDPVLFLGKVKRVLKEKGKVIIEVPNADDALLTLYDIPAFRDYYYTPAHHFYYTAETLKALLKKAGFNGDNVKLLQRYDLSNHMHWMLTGRPGGQGSYNNVFSRKLNDTYMSDLVKAGKADTLFAVVTKEGD